MGMNEESFDLTIEELKVEVDDLKELVKTLLTIIMEEADGVESGSAPQMINHPSRGYVM
jgi:hypothetical protein|tara:strand:- start:178 stop:354 length:177 start_codon:yes stop_codon:yes gene_type:complete